jgi:hypothetical protein
MLSWYTAKWKYCLQIIQIIAKLNELLNHILNMNWLYHFNCNWKVWLIWFHKKHLDKFFIRISKSVLKKNIFLKIIFIWKMTRIMLEAFVLESILYVYQNAKWNERKFAPKIYQNVLKRVFLFGLKQPPYYVISPHGVWKFYFDNHLGKLWFTFYYLVKLMCSF